MVCRFKKKKKWRQWTRFHVCFPPKINCLVIRWNILSLLGHSRSQSHRKQDTTSLHIEKKFMFLIIYRDNVDNGKRALPDGRVGSTE